MIKNVIIIIQLVAIVGLLGTVFYLVQVNKKKVGPSGGSGPGRTGEATTGEA